MKWIQLALKKMEQFVKTMNFQVPRSENFQTSGENLSFSRRTLLHAVRY